MSGLSGAFPLAVCGSAALAVAVTRPASAAPQVSAGATLGGVVENVEGAGATRGGVHVGGRADVLFLRERGRDMAIGPYVDVASTSFRDVDLGGGASWLLPVRDDLPIVLSVGGFARNGESLAWSPGLDATLFFGSRSYNFHSVYGIATGLFAQGRWLPGADGRADIVVGLQLDAELMMLPGLLIFEALRN